ncbi:unnamed protein product [Owenia fusiformis]|uniref:Uncharacterized protein n=1 Tax=Owenia fusiformis TaxID=6347 RepID=A0A8J1UQR5_OWEFU|nr:unnamed protein product [Owenia fusiformis]
MSKSIFLIKYIYLKLVVSVGTEKLEEITVQSQATGFILRGILLRWQNQLFQLIIMVAGCLIMRSSVYHRLHLQLAALQHVLLLTRSVAACSSSSTRPSVTAYSSSSNVADTVQTSSGAVRPSTSTDSVQK